MATPVSCPVCRVRLPVPEDLVGARVRCAQCRATLRIERAENGSLEPRLVRDPAESVAQRRERARADRARHTAPARRRWRNTVLTWLTLVAALVVAGAVFSEVFFALAFLIGVYLPIGLWRQAARVRDESPLRGAASVRRRG